jgi:hypothetical protein
MGNRFSLNYNNDKQEFEFLLGVLKDFSVHKKGMCFLY